MPKYKLDMAHVDRYEEGDYALWLPYGFRFADDTAHVRSFDTMQELRAAARHDVVACNCAECTSKQGD